MFQRALIQLNRLSYCGITTVEPLSTIAKSVPKSPQREQNAALEAALNQVNSIVAGNGNHQNLQRVISDEVDVVTEILQKLVGTNRSLSQVEQIYAGTNHETIHGLSVLLFSKMFPKTATASKVFQAQLVVAKVVEMINMAMRVHDMVRNIDAEDIAKSEAGQAIHLNNKCSVLYGDFMWAKAWKDLADLHQMSVIDHMVTVLVNTTQGQFLLEQEAHLIDEKMNPEYWLKKNILVSGCLPGFGCRSVLELAETPKEFYVLAQEFGENFGLYMKGLREIKWFQKKTRESEPIDFLSLPLILHTNLTENDASSMIVAGERSSDPATINFEQLHKTVRNGPGIDEAKARIQQFRASAFDTLNCFPDSDAKVCLKRILDSLY